MATKTQQPTPFSRLSRIGRRGSRIRGAKDTNPEHDDEDWYIPYNGPYELPKETLPRPAQRDSWGNAEEYSRDLFGRYGDEQKPEYAGGWNAAAEEKVVPTRGRLLSTASRSSGTLDPARRSLISTQSSSNLRSRRLLHATSGRLPVPSFINLDAAGGVGESPVSHHALPSPRTPAGMSRTVGFANIFPGNRRSQHVPVHSQGETSTASPTLRPSTSTNHGHGQAGPEGGDYYHSYYSTLLTTPNPAKASQSHQVSPINTSHPSEASHRPHPYAYVFPSAAFSAVPRSAPPPPSAKSKPHDTLPTKPSKPSSFLKSSISTPNLRRSSPGPSQRSGKDRWLSAETWCDALLFPRPRFKVKGGSGRIVSPPGTPIMGEKLAPTWEQEVTRPLTKARSAANLLSSPRTDMGPSLTRAGSTRRRGYTLPNTSSVHGGPNAGQASPPVGDGGVNTKSEHRKSFAHDDLALPSPVPSLAYVLEEGQRLDQQRRQWQRQASHSFQNKRTRSLSRSRAKSLAQRRREVDQGRAIDFLAARSFLGMQGVPPTVHFSAPNSPLAPGMGTLSSNSHGRSSSRSHSHSNSNVSSQRRGHARNESWGKSALKLAKSTAGLCGFAGDMSISPVDDKGVIVLDNVLKGQSTLIPPKYADEKHRNGLVTVAVTDPRGSPATVARLSAGGLNGVSPTPSSGEAVGIALSTPPPSNDHSHETYDSDAFQLRDHPYAQSAAFPYHAGTSPVFSHSRSHSAKGSDYAGPHPSSVVSPSIKSAAATEVSIRHRLPPQATVHPYTRDQPHPYAMGFLQEDNRLHPRVRADSHVPPPAKMYAELSPGDVREILPDEIQYSPYLPAETNSGHQMHAYAAATHNKHRQTKLGVEEALSYSLQKRRSRDSGIETNEEVGMREHSRERGGSESIAVSKDSSSRSPYVRRKPVFYDQQDLPELSHAPDPYSAHTVASSPSDRLQPPSFRGAPFQSPNIDSRNNSFASRSSSSPAGHSGASSPQVSPRPLGNGDDLERFRDLFYRPDQADTPRLDSAEEPSGLPFDVTPQGERKFSTLTEELNNQLEELNEHAESSVSAADRTSRGSSPSDRHFSGIRSRRPTEDSTSSPFVLSEALTSTSPSTVESTLPLHLPTEQGNMSTLHPSTIIPEDVESSRASSILERSPLEDDTFGVPRMRSLEAVSTPPAMATQHRKSSHLSLFEEEEAEEDQGPGEDATSPTSPADASNRILSHSSSLYPPPSADLARSSYVTSDTNTSRMSGLSDFPAPPHVSPAHMSLIQSYFSDSPLRNVEDPLLETQSQSQTAQGERKARDRRRMTFGGDEDVELEDTTDYALSGI